MAWERSFEAKILKIREKELKYQKLNYLIEVSLRSVCEIICSLMVAREDALECYLVCCIRVRLSKQYAK